MTRIGSGIYLLDLAIGTGAELQIEHRVVVSYALYLADGTLVEQRNSLSFRMSFI